tara:strand:+ start:1422 stop:1625 length:204 start_codon:yes stop_codon:yes gene_type:complete
MKEIYRTNNPVELSYILHELAENGIQGFDFDRHTSMAEGSIGAIQRRLMVSDEDHAQAIQIIESLDL